MQQWLSKRAVLVEALTEVTELLIIMRLAGMDTTRVEDDATRIAKRLMRVNRRIEDGLDQNS
ncbi:hypothetical protein UFOVP609_42 [uncultured Caudovirales phage]|uniref:Uncharacterized protein n=1 Tax=uncultured Caudovirales phage TaxID=2100421 RepID=A0A6J5N0G0_9CAUD|nr:hypothetical protein UFOVP609_42 [uncultured Caudovirales phage]